MTLTVYAHTDTSAPVLTGETGKLNDLLDAILINGYGSKSAAGWSVAYSDATSKTKCYRPASGPRHYLQSQDNGPGAGSYREARWRGYVAMSAYDTGTEPFPTVAQRTNGLFVRKATALDTTPRAWIAAADDATLVLFIHAGDASAYSCHYVFGKFASWKASDAYASVIIGRITENTTSYAVSNAPQLFAGWNSSSTIIGYRPRSYSAVGSAVALWNTYNISLDANSSTLENGSAGNAYPYPVDGGLTLSPLYLIESTTPVGTLPGIWRPLHNRPLLDGDTFSVVDGSTTRDFRAIHTGAAGQEMLETTDTWYTA